MTTVSLRGLALRATLLVSPVMGAFVPGLLPNALALLFNTSPLVSDALAPSLPRVDCSSFEGKVQSSGESPRSFLVAIPRFVSASSPESEPISPRMDDLHVYTQREEEVKQEQPGIVYIHSTSCDSSKTLYY